MSYSFWNNFGSCQIVFMLAIFIMIISLFFLFDYFNNGVINSQINLHWGEGLLILGLLIAIGTRWIDYYKYYKIAVIEPRKQRKHQIRHQKKQAKKIFQTRETEFSKKQRIKVLKIIEGRKKAFENWGFQLLDLLLEPERYNDPEITNYVEKLWQKWNKFVLVNCDNNKNNKIISSQNGKILTTFTEEEINLNNLEKVEKIIAFASRKREVIDSNGNKIPVVALINYSYC